MVGGEQLQFEDQEKFYERLPWATLENLYGPTEASVDVTYWKCLRHREGRMIPIGRPLANVKMYILDSHLRAVPIGVSGELHIGGVAIARGYHNRPEMTADKFIPNPYGEGGERLYKTGDLARYREDGEIEFLGRIDNQVKVRGFRIELGEIEAVLSEHEKVKDVVVVVREEAGGDKRLVGYVVGEGEVGGGELRRYLSERLPEYMVPNVIVVLEQTPLLPNGKVNRAALPAPEWGKSTEQVEYVGPRTPVEETVVKIWKAVLNVERVSVEDDFFEIGGHSLLATQVITRINHAFNLSMPLRKLFEKTSIAEIALAIEAELITEIANLSEAEVGSTRE
jgi:acyl-CoA synthetase (AMP-forming)/AMP-acid ligase II/acyl carrier protein